MKKFNEIYNNIINEKLDNKKLKDFADNIENGPYGFINTDDIQRQFEDFSDNTLTTSELKKVIKYLDNQGLIDDTRTE